MGRLIFTGMLSCVLAACGGGSSSGGGTAGEGESPLARALAPYIYSEEERAFFAEEAAKVGVRTIRPMEPDEEIPSRFGDRPACGQAQYGTNSILIHPQGHCRTFYHNLIAHEIAHFGAESTCHGPGGGHGPPFFDYFRGIAERYAARFSGGGGWRDPVRSVERSERRYQEIDAYRCRGVLDGIE